MSFGYIYKITNKLNGKCYIGQTSKTIEYRFNEHILDAKKRDYPLYRAFNKYGIENFYIEEIEKCNINQLNEKEILYIKKYNSYHSGYNATLGGGGRKQFSKSDKEVIDKYLELGTVDSVCKHYKASKRTIGFVLNNNNIKIESASEHAKKKGSNIYRIDIDTKEILETYNSLHDAFKWVMNKGLTKIKDSISGIRTIKQAILLKRVSYGFLWDSDCYLEHDKEEARTKLKKQLEKSKELQRTNKDKRKIVCPICGINKMSKESNKCIECEKKIVKEVSTENLHNKISRDDLKNLIRTTPFITIGAQYNVSDKAITKWCKKYNLPSTKTEIKKYSDEEWKNI